MYFILASCVLLEISSCFLSLSHSLLLLSLQQNNKRIENKSCSIGDHFIFICRFGVGLFFRFFFLLKLDETFTKQPKFNRKRVFARREHELLVVLDCTSRTMCVRALFISRLFRNMYHLRGAQLT